MNPLVVGSNPTGPKSGPLIARIAAVCAAPLCASPALAQAVAPIPPAAPVAPAAAAPAAKPSAAHAASRTAHANLPRVLVRGARFNSATRYAHSLPEVSGTAITVTKKTTVVDLGQVPTIIDNDQRELFDRLPGVVLAEQQNPTELNISYRGLGNPQESEYVLLMQDGIPLELDWIGYPTTYYLPVPQTLSSVQMIRGGSGLLYGPEPEPVINFVSLPPDPDRALAGTSEQVGGTHELYSSFNRLSGTSGDWDYLADFSHRSSSGERENGDYELDSGDLSVGYRLAPGQKLTVELHAYSLDSGLAGLMSGGQFAADPNLATTPDDRLWTDRDTAVLTYQGDFSAHDTFVQKLWTGYTDLITRSDSYTPAYSATGSTLAGQRFHYTGLDGRWLHRWARGNALTVGYTVYESHSPYDEWTSANALVGRNDESGTPLYADDRRSHYGALFAENVFRLPGRFHVVTSGRFNYEELSTHESIAAHPYLVNASYAKNAPLFGIGIGNDFGRGNETYVNVSQGFRPVRYLDIASPFGKFSPTNDPDPTKYLTYEAGVHGWPIPGLYYDASLFQVDVRNRLESEALTPVETIDVNTGSTRNRGAELETSYDLLGGGEGNATGAHLYLFANASYLDARFTSSIILGQVGKIPAYSPPYVLKGGLTLAQDQRYKLSLVIESVAAQYFQDSDLPIGTTAARIPTYTVVDLAGDYRITRHWRVLAGVSNLLDRRYYSRVFLAGGELEPALELAAYAGAAYDL